VKGQYSLKKTDIALYELEIMRAGCCGALAAGCFFETDSDYVLSLELSGLKGALSVLQPKGRELFSGYRALLCLLRKILEAIALAEDFLIPAAHISFAPDDLLIDSHENIRLVLKPQSGNLPERLCALLTYIEKHSPGMHAAHLASLVPEYADTSYMLRELSILELELLR